MCKTVSVINMKGGVGKSTITVNLAWHMAAYKKFLKKVLVVDLDPQFNTSQYLIGAEEYRKRIALGKPTVWDIFEQHTRTPSGKAAPIDPNDAVISVVDYVEGSKIDLIPSRLELALSLRNPGQKADLLDKFLSKIKSNYDLILIDCAPTESVLTTAAYLASDSILVPVKPEYLSTIGLPLLASSMGDFLSEHDSNKLSLLGIIFNSVSGYSPEEANSKKEVADLAKRENWPIFQSEIPFSRSYPKGAREGKPIFNTSYARTSQATSFVRFADEFSAKLWP